jgi:RNase adapter protein RapZ
MKRTTKKTSRQFVVITGLSGSGKGSVLKAFEDLGFYCVDNLPVDLIPMFAELCATPGSRIERAAVVVDIRGGEALSQLPEMYRGLDGLHLKTALVFLEANDAALVRRFVETRRPHPMGRDLPVREGIRLERLLLKPMRQLADVTIDTTKMNVHELRDSIQSRFGRLEKRQRMLVAVASFGFRYGVLSDADLVFDVRFLPNPQYDQKLRPKTGRDLAVQRYIDSFHETREFVKRVTDLLLYLLPQYMREGKSYLTIGFGCTGGRHRSVAMAEKLAERISREGYKVKVTHRDVGKTPS